MSRQGAPKSTTQIDAECSCGPWRRIVDCVSRFVRERIGSVFPFRPERWSRMSPSVFPSPLDGYRRQIWFRSWNPQPADSPAARNRLNPHPMDSPAHVANLAGLRITHLGFPPTMMTIDPALAGKIVTLPNADRIEIHGTATGSPATVSPANARLVCVSYEKWFGSAPTNQARRNADRTRATRNESEIRPRGYACPGD